MPRVLLRFSCTCISIIKVTIVGGAGAVSENVENALMGGPFGLVERVAGPDRYATAAAIAALKKDNWGVAALQDYYPSQEQDNV